MTSLLSAPGAAALVAIDEADGATLTEIARATRKPLSTIQRSVEGLVGAGVLVRESPRGRLVFAPGAPRQALRELARWRLRSADPAASSPGVPATVTNPRIRKAWPQAIGSIVAAYHPRRVILFGSQARGDARPDSDVDLLVVFDDDGDRRERRVGIRRVLDEMPFAKDVLVASTADLDHPIRGTALADAVREGMVVYER